MTQYSSVKHFQPITIFNYEQYKEQFKFEVIQIQAYQNIHNVGKNFLQRKFKKHFGLPFLRKCNLGN